jgi:hypothetical protein
MISLQGMAEFGCSFLKVQNSFKIFANRVQLLINKHVAIQKPWL